MWKIFVFYSLLLQYTGHAREARGRCFTPTLENGWVEAQEGVTGDTFVGSFRCQPGFILSGATTVKCRQGRWSVRPDNFPLCAAIGSCDPAKLPSIKNGWKKANPRYANSVYRYSCKKGYRMMGTSTVFCTQAGWSVKQAPVCTRAGCDLGQIMGEEGIPHGRARTLWGGAAIRFSCKAGSFMDGSPFAYCDGKEWNGTKPECHVPPTEPLFSVLHDQVAVENPLVGAGEEVVLECSSTGGNPAPSLALYVGEEKVATSVSGSTLQYSLTVQPVHDTVQVYCTAYNTMVHTPVHSTVQVLRLKYAASNTFIRGPRVVMSEEYTQYSCSSDEADPAPRMEIIATDQDGEIIDIHMEKMPMMKGRKGFAARVIFGINFEDHIKIADIECKAVNEVGEASTKLTTRVQYAPDTVEITGVTTVKHDEDNVVYTCSTSPSYPEATLVWTKLVQGNLVKIEEKDTKVETEHTRSGVRKSSRYTYHPARTQDDSFLLFCIVKIKELKYEASSEVLDIVVTYPPKKVFITGPDSVTVGDEAEYGCVVEGGHPPPTPILVITDQYQNPIQSIPVSNTSISVVVTKDHTTLFTSCFVGNEAGYLQTTKDITVTSPPSTISVTGPDHVKDGHPGVYHCHVGEGYPTPTIQWKVVTTSGDTLNFVTEQEDDEEKGSMSQLEVTGNKTLGDITVECIATNIAGYTQSSISTIVTYTASHLLLTGPTTISPATPPTYYCSTDNSVPASTIVWTIHTATEEGTDTVDLDEDDVENYETALVGGGVQTHSVLTLPDYLLDKNIQLEIRCEATEDPEELFDMIEVTGVDLKEDIIETFDDDVENVNTAVDKELEVPVTTEEKGEGFRGKNLFKEETFENAIKEDAVAGNKNKDKMVKLEAVEYDSDNYDNDYYTNQQENAEQSFAPSISEHSNKEYGTDEPTFQRAEVGTVNIAMKLGDSPRQAVDMSPYSSAPKPAVKIWLLVLTAVFFWRG